MPLKRPFIRFERLSLSLGVAVFRNALLSNARATFPLAVLSPAVLRSSIIRYADQPFHYLSPLANNY